MREWILWFMIGFFGGRYVISPMVGWIAVGIIAVLMTGLRECPDCGQYHR